MSQFLEPYHDRQASDGRQLPSSRGRSAFRIQRPSNRIRGGSSYVQPARSPSTAVMEHRAPEIILRTREAWEKWGELSVKISNLSSIFTTLDLWKCFEKEGHISLIEIFENNRGVRDGFARVRFTQPPPVRPFWNSIVTIALPRGEGHSRIKVELEPPKRSFQIQSPIRKHVWYPEIMRLVPTMLVFGLMHDRDSMMDMRTIEAPPRVPRSAPNQMKLTLDLLHHRVTVKFSLDLVDSRTVGTATCPLHSSDRTNKYMFQIPFTQLRKINRVNIGKDHWALIFSLDSPPAFYRKRQQEVETHEDKSFLWKEFDTWFRQTNIVYDPGALQRTAVSLDKRAPVIDIGKYRCWTSYRLVFQNDQDGLAIFEIMKQALEDWNVQVLEAATVTTVTGTPPAIWSIINPLTLSPELAQFTDQWFHGEDTHITLPFEMSYQLEVCISQNLINEHNITKEFISRLGDLALKDPVKGRTVLEYIAEQEVRIYDPLSIFGDEEAFAYSPNSKVPHYCGYTRKATITPTMIYFSTPTVEMTNRVIRHYASFADRFLRVQFTGEKTEGRINSCADKTRDDEIYLRVYRTLANGIQIGHRHYEFLAFGNSQFRENGAYFFCPHEHLTCDDIRQWMGNFTDIRVVAKYAARLGQCFSTTRAIHSARVKIVKLEDVERNGYCFTDGVGKISDLLANLIAQDLNLPSDMSPPSAFQFRMGGCKGILAVWPDAKGQEVHIRKSQQKFTAVYNGLEIIRCSQFSTAALNRQTIVILSSLGVPDEVFNRMLLEQLSNYQAALGDRAIALDLLSRYIDSNQMTLTIAGMVVDGFMDSREPFLMSLLHLWRCWSIKALKEKARIIVEKGAFLLGVVDETGILKGHKNQISTMPGCPMKLEDLPQIFVQVPERSQTGRYVVIDGICVLGRNPSLHPGDIRVVRAIDVPALHHLRDVVVFPQQGDRDVPSMCSGGDLDGDDFFVLWDKDLEPKEWNVKAMSYSVPKPMELGKPIKIQDLMRFFVRFMKNDTLPTIALAHVAQSDYRDRGVKDPVCLRLAELHSKAVDYVKTGEKATMEKDLIPRRWPHFMEKKFKPKEAIYVSEKILGQLYDKVESVDFIPQYEAPFDHRILNAYPVDAALLKEARLLKYSYDTAMKRVMAQHEIRTEFEIWSAFVLSKPRVGTDYKMHEVMADVSIALKTRFRKNCTDVAGGKDFDKLAPFVAAMYRVTYEEMDSALGECRMTRAVGGKEVPLRSMEPRYMPLMSFPWIFHDVLGRIANRVLF